MIVGECQRYSNKIGEDKVLDFSDFLISFYSLIEMISYNGNYEDFISILGPLKAYPYHIRLGCLS